MRCDGRRHINSVRSELERVARLDERRAARHVARALPAGVGARARAGAGTGVRVASRGCLVGQRRPLLCDVCARIPVRGRRQQQPLSRGVRESGVAAAVERRGPSGAALATAESELSQQRQRPAGAAARGGDWLPPVPAAGQRDLRDASRVRSVREPVRVLSVTCAANQPPALLASAVVQRVREARAAQRPDARQQRTRRLRRRRRQALQQTARAKPGGGVPASARHPDQHAARLSAGHVAEDRRGIDARAEAPRQQAARSDNGSREERRRVARQRRV